MRLLIVNPNTTVATTEVIRAAAVRAAASGTEIVAVTALSGPPIIVTPDQSAAAGPVVVETMLANQQGMDAAITAAFSDPGLLATRAALPFPVVGIAQAAMTEAARIAERFTLVTFSDAMEPIYRRLATDYGVGAALANIRFLYPLLGERTHDSNAIREVMVEQCRRGVQEDGAGAIVIGGGPLSGLAEALSNEFTVPLLDGVRCAVRLAERLVGPTARAANCPSFVPP
jgi:allantoin racemase